MNHAQDRKCRIQNVKWEVVHFGKCGQCGHSAQLHVAKELKQEPELVGMVKLEFIVLEMPMKVLHVLLPILVLLCGETGINAQKLVEAVSRHANDLIYATVMSMSKQLPATSIQEDGLLGLIGQLVQHHAEEVKLTVLECTLAQVNGKSKLSDVILITVHIWPGHNGQIAPHLVLEETGSEPDNIRVVKMIKLNQDYVVKVGPTACGHRGLTVHHAMKLVRIPSSNSDPVNILARKTAKNKTALAKLLGVPITVNGVLGALARRLADLDSLLDSEFVSETIVHLCLVQILNLELVKVEMVQTITQTGHLALPLAEPVQDLELIQILVQAW